MTLLQEFYKASKKRFDEDDLFKERAQEAVVRLQVSIPVLIFVANRVFPSSLAVVKALNPLPPLFPLPFPSSCSRCVCVCVSAPDFCIFLGRIGHFVGCLFCFLLTVIIFSHLGLISMKSGEDKYRDAWKRICEISRREFDLVYERLGVHLEVKVRIIGLTNPFVVVLLS